MRVTICLSHFLFIRAALPKRQAPSKKVTRQSLLASVLPERLRQQFPCPFPWASVFWLLLKAMPRALLPTAGHPSGIPAGLSCPPPLSSTALFLLQFVSEPRFILMSNRLSQEHQLSYFSCNRGKGGLMPKASVSQKMGVLPVTFWVLEVAGSQTRASCLPGMSTNASSLCCVLHAFKWGRK